MKNFFSANIENILDAPESDLELLLHFSGVKQIGTNFIQGCSVISIVLHFETILIQKSCIPVGNVYPIYHDVPAGKDLIHMLFPSHTFYIRVLPAILTESLNENRKYLYERDETIEMSAWNALSLPGHWQASSISRLS